VLIWSGPGGGGGARLAEAAHRLGFADRAGCAAFHLPATPNGRGVAEAWSAAADADEADPEPIELLVVSGDDAAADPGVRALAEHSRRVIAVTLFHDLVGGWADLVLPATAALEREGTLLNLEGRLQRLRRAVAPPVPDELSWLAELAGRFEIELPSHASLVFEEVAAVAFGSVTAGEVGAQGRLSGRAPYSAPDVGTTQTAEPSPAADDRRGLQLVRYRPLFAGPQVERIEELRFQRPERVVELAPGDAERRGITTGDTVLVRSNGTSVELRARVNRRLLKGVVRVAQEHVAELHDDVEVAKA
jgi:predicted molibdopterin-dependent oxidoreductase YjgC